MDLIEKKDTGVAADKPAELDRFDRHAMAGERNVCLLCDQLRQRGLAHAGRTDKKDVIESLPSFEGGLDVDLQTCLEFLLSDEFREISGSMGFWLR